MLGSLSILMPSSFLFADFDSAGQGCLEGWRNYMSLLVVGASYP